ncbi:MAG: anthranilate synthase component I family protein [Thermoplasmatota archaeon]
MLKVPVPAAPPPHAAHARLARRHATSFVLESRDGPEDLARHSIVGWAPLGTVTLERDRLTVDGGLPDPGGQEPFAYLRGVLRQYPAKGEGPFCGGFVGCAGHALARTFEPTLETGATPNATEPWPRLLLGFYLDALVYDHAKGTCDYVSLGPDRRGDLAALRDPDPPTALNVGALRPTADEGAFTRRVLAGQELVRAGECFQIVLSRAYEGPFEGDLGACYARLREGARVPFLFHLRFPGRTLLGASPERLVQVRGRCAETYPIAGTRPRTGQPEVDAAAARDLVADPKENAEHAMLVDLARNDLARVCEPGTVEVERFREVESFRAVMHLVSRVAGKLQPGRDALDALAALFPAGTVSGAPKVRALEHLDRLEARERGAYAGAVLYLGADGGLDSAITLRSLSATHDGGKGTLAVQAGVGIVLGSKPAAEFQETRHKARACLDALKPFGATLAGEAWP